MLWSPYLAIAFAAWATWMIYEGRIAYVLIILVVVVVIRAISGAYGAIWRDRSREYKEGVKGDFLRLGGKLLKVGEIVLVLVALAWLGLAGENRL